MTVNDLGNVASLSLFHSLHNVQKCIYKIKNNLDSKLTRPLIFFSRFT